MSDKSAIALKRAYDVPAKTDGQRLLVDRLWPRGVKKEKLHLDDWLKTVAPSDQLRKWFGHDAAKWPEFQRRYFAELNEHPESWRPLAEELAAGRHVTLVFGASDTEHNNAVALKAYLDRKL
jgi:uncharacterized protein YeaO (DUF488 family)